MEVGPVDIYIIGFPGNKFTGRIAPAIGELVNSGTIRILDLLFVTKDENGVIGTLSAADIGPEGAAYAEIEITEPGALSHEDAEELDEDLPPGARHCSSRSRTPGPRSSLMPSRPPTRWSSTRSASRRTSFKKRSPPSPPSSERHHEKEGSDMGLLRMATRTAVVAGTATAVSGRVARRQNAKYAAQDQQAYEQQQQQ